MRRSLLIEFLQDLKNGAEILGRLAGFLFLQCIPAQLAQVLEIGARPGGGDVGKRRFVFEEARA
jgi:hypothetical protein